MYCVQRMNQNVLNVFRDKKKCGATKEKKQINKTSTIFLSASKGNINKMEKQPTKWKKLFANYLSDKRLISRIYKEVLQLNNK